MLDHEAIKWYNEFSTDLRERVRTEDMVQWDGVGILRKDDGGNILFEPAPADGLFMSPTPAIRVSHQNAHTLLVGDQERTNVEMNEWLHDEEAARKGWKKSWWIIALVLALLALAALGWHFYVNGWVIGNQRSLIIP